MRQPGGYGSSEEGRQQRSDNRLERADIERKYDDNPKPEGQNDQSVEKIGFHLKM